VTVSDPGAGQQQGREVCELSQRVDGQWHSWRFDGDDPYVICHYCGRVQDAVTGRVMDEGRNPAPSPTPPARDSGRDEAREAVARWLWEQDGYAGSWEREDQQDYYREDADRLLALPELDKLLRRPA